MKIVTLVAALTAFGLTGTAAAQDPVGDWIGKVVTPGGIELTLAAHIRKAPDGRLEGYAESPDQSTVALAMADVTAEDGALSFEMPLVRAKFAGRWDDGAWVGALTQNGADMPLRLTPGLPPARPVVSGLDGAWAGVIAAPQGELRIQLDVKTDAAGTLALFRSPDQSPLPLVAQLSRKAENVTFELRGIGEFEGALSADGGTLDGRWRQGGAVLPLTLRKGG
ncbi:hypothetical protein [Phenylobacterium kunshanense]|uniref:Type II secretion system protein N n=1 Tax=Phenylobacterium kunshanense TaxID=1445034 RepID=A0A328BIA0_9CAUL|nr:hypothetical protein [Phenylobacterium kunshanense]RAK67212.1 hypothetical protein DJ019_04560 [Phenylobacterium kunshanense]